MDIDGSYSLFTCPDELSGVRHGTVWCMLSLADVLSHFKTLQQTKSETETLFFCCRKEKQPILAGFFVVWVFFGFCFFFFLNIV